MSRKQFWAVNYLTGCGLFLLTAAAFWIGYGLWGWAWQSDYCTTDRCWSETTTYTPASIYFRLIFCSATVMIWSALVIGVIYVWWTEHFIAWLGRGN